MPISEEAFINHVCHLRQITNTIIEEDESYLYSSLFLMHFQQVVAVALRPGDYESAAFEALMLADAEHFQAGLLVFHTEFEDADPPPGVKVMGQCYVSMTRTDTAARANCSPYIWDQRRHRAYFIDNDALPTWGANFSTNPFVVRFGSELRERFHRGPTGGLTAKVQRLESLGNQCHLIDL